MVGFDSAGGSLITVDLTDPGEAGEIVANEESQNVQNSLGLSSTEAMSEARTVAAPTKLGTRLHLYNFDATQDIAVTFPAAFDQSGNTIATYSAGTAVAIFESTPVGLNEYRWMLMSRIAVALS